MKPIYILFIFGLFAGCDCDSICQANRSTKKLLVSDATNKEIIEYLNEYKGEAPGAASYGTFVVWGKSNPERFLKILNHSSITKKNLDLVAYQIADKGDHSVYCQIYESKDITKNDQYIRKRLLGCKYGL